MERKPVKLKNKLLNHLKIGKIYKPENYKKDPVNYCGMKIYSTPYDFKK